MLWEVGRVKAALKNIVGKEMGEVGMGSEEGGNGAMELMPLKETQAAAEEETSCRKKKKKKKMLPAINHNHHHDDDDDEDEDSASAAASAVVRWGSFLPKMVLRVLLVEADDSTRQIIAALLRKCSYRVAAVADGLKAWEVLKGRPHNIDLILTEIDLPAISGFALLTLIMEHEICKNIPVIMMSSQDSVSTVYKCMLRGAADFLVKPVRKNELRNLWQHVWRRQASSSSGVEPQDESVAQQKVEATAENYVINNYSSDYMVSIQKNRESFDKGSDAQRSCTKPGLDAEGAEMECMQGLSYSKWSKPPQSSNFDKQKQESCQLVNKKVQAMDHEAQDVSRRDSQVMNSGEDINSGVHWECGLATGHGPENNHLRVDSAREAIDLIGTFDNYLKCSPRESGFSGGAFKVDSLPQLDLSLRRSLPSGSVNQVTDERHRLNHSDASAFSRYVNRTARPQCSTSPSICNHQKVEKSNSDRQLSNDTVINNLEKHIDLPVAQPGEIETRTQQRLLPAPVAIRGVRLENISNGYGFLVPQPFRTQSQMLQSSGSVNHQEASLQVNAFYRLNHQTGNPQKYSGLVIHECNDMDDQNENMEGHKLEAGEDRGRISSATDQSANSSFCNGSESYFHSQRSASNDKVDTVPFMSTEGCGHEETFRAHDGNSIKSVQRAAALTKFRLKRKERCFEKKVRYESRKKLAEKRPRVKGQFVRQAIDDSPPGNSSAG